MTTDPSNLNRLLPLIARSGLTEDELLDFVEGELPADRSAAVLRTLAAHPELSGAVMGMRSDRGRLSHELELVAAEPDRSFVEAVVHQGVTGELDPAFAALFESTGRAGGGVPRMRPTRVVRAHRRLGWPARAAGVLLAACVAGAFFGAVWLAWPSAPVSLGAPRLAEAPPTAPAEAGALAEAAPLAARAPVSVAQAPADGLPAHEWGPTTTIVTPAEALAAAREGRLVIRLYAPDAALGRGLVESITTTPSISRVAVLDGPVTDVDALRIAGAVPTQTGPVYAGDPASVDTDRPAPSERASWVYMVEVEPTERGVSLLLAGLSRRPGVLVELLRSGEPVTTPGSAGDVSWFRGPSRDWTRRIAAPIVVQSGER